MKNLSRAACLVALATWALLFASPAAAQYFGRNKVQYDDFDFQILRTQHFDVYFYPEERKAVSDAARMAERWYERHSRTFLRQFQERKPLIFYANDADFQQTNVIGGQIGQGTGGVTEALKERVVMPLTGIYAETNHVLGHELVHSFQYDIALNRQDSVRFQLQRLPLWLVEGMAEYLSVGRVDAHTAMWLRDAALRDDLPTIEQLTTDRSYFPYRYGQAYMAYIGGKYGDAAVANLYKLSGTAGPDSAISYTLGITPDSLSEEWKQAVKDSYLPLIEDRTSAEEAGEPLLTEETVGGRIHIAPALSPNGKYVAYLSEQDIFSIDLFVADAETGEVVADLQGPAASPHFDALRFISSAGTWSPDGQRLAFVTFVEGDNEIAIWNVNSGDIERRLSVEDVTAITNLAWSPDGQTIAFTGLDGGISDLYLFDLDQNTVRQLTNDRYADLQPAWSPDGGQLAFVTDRGPNGTNFETLDFTPGRLGLIEVTSGDIEVLRPFGDALHHNPQFSSDGESLFFISTYNGFKDIYRQALDTGETYRVTRLATGVSGITELSPAMSVARETGRMAFSVFSDNNYTIHALSEEQTQGEPAEPLGDGVPTAAVLPPFRPATAGLVGSYLNDPVTDLPEASSFSVRDYSARLRLDRVAPPSVGVSVGGPYGGGVAGGVGFLFSDMLGDHNLTALLQANGTWKDIGGQVSYVNRDNRLNYGVSAGHIPLRSVFYQRNPQNPLLLTRIIQRLYITSASGSAYYPFSTTQRFELGAGFTRYGFGLEAQQISRFGGRGERQNLDELEGDNLYFFTGSAAFVGDYSYTGFTSPLQGGRYRFEATPYVGTFTFVQGLADYRRYFFFNPVTFAVRGLHIGKYGIDQDSGTGQGISGQLTRNFSTLYLDSPYYPGFIRGYDYSTFTREECTPSQAAGGCAELANLQGTHIAMASVELRLPLLGTEQLGLFNFPYLPTELALFGDGGVAWTAADPPELTLDGDLSERIPVFSTGVTARFNLLGYIVFETYYAYPFQRPEEGGHFGFVLRPGW